MFEKNKPTYIMKKLLLIMAIIGASNGLYSQTCDEYLPILEDFEDSNVINVCWNLIDQDGDGYNWRWRQYGPTYGGYTCLTSDEWSAALGYIYPDNWIYSYAIDLTSFSPSEDIEISWKVRGELASLSHINYSVYAATDNQISDFESSPNQRSEYVDEVGGAGTFVTRTLNISALAGNMVYVAFRHQYMPGGDEYIINIDDVEVKINGTLGIDDLEQDSFSHYYNSNTDLLTIKSPNTPMNAIQIYNVLGQTVINKKLNQNEELINLSTLVDGVYIMKVRIDNFEKTIKFLKH